jgi:hypothetical protein
MSSEAIHLRSRFLSKVNVQQVDCCTKKEALGSAIYMWSIAAESSRMNDISVNGSYSMSLLLPCG